MRGASCNSYYSIVNWRWSVSVAKDSATVRGHLHTVADNITTMLVSLLLMLSIFASLYDLRTRRIPNWVTLPLLIAGLIAHFPGTVELWLVCLALESAWAMSWMGGGDTKLWMAMFWILPPNWIQEATVTMLTALFITGLIQLIWRRLRKQAVLGVQRPGAWRTIPFAAWLFFLHAY